MDTRKIAVVGCGAISATHVLALKAAGLEISALCDILPERARALSDKFELDAEIYTDYNELLQKARPYAVHICTPHYLHAPMCAQALRRDINVLCEKPLCISAAELDMLISLQKESRAALGVCHQNRYEPNMIKLRELASAGVRGGMGIVNWKRDKSYYRSGEWRGKKATEGGGVMINQALHTLDLLQWICGMPDYVTAHLSNDRLSGVIEVEDTAAALFETENGRSFQFYATTSGSADFPAQIQIVTQDGKLYYADSHRLCGPCGQMQSVDTGAGVGKKEWGARHSALIADFYQKIGAGQPFPIDAAEAGRVLRLIFAMYLSDGRKIPVEKG